MDLPGQPARQPPNPGAGFSTGLDVFAARTLGTLPTLGMLRYMLGIGPGGPGGNAEPRHILSLHDEHELTFRATRPIAFQVDGGVRRRARARHLPFGSRCPARHFLIHQSIAGAGVRAAGAELRGNRDGQIATNVTYQTQKTVQAFAAAS
jgi:hypothetical protein